jgi:CheY-like chemotaxis protein
MNREPVHILLVEDNPADARLAQEVLRGSAVLATLHVVGDGDEAMAFLRKESPYQGEERPDLVLLDLNLPRKDGREVLAELNADPVLRVIPVVVLTTSQAEIDIQRAYELNANAYVTKPVDLDEFITAMRSLESFWMHAASLPRG